MTFWPRWPAGGKQFNTETFRLSHTDYPLKIRKKKEKCLGRNFSGIFQAWYWNLGFMDINSKAEGWDSNPFCVPENLLTLIIYVHLWSLNFASDVFINGANAGNIYQNHRLIERRITKVREKRPEKVVKLLVLVFSVVANGSRRRTTCMRSKRERARRK